MIAIRNLKKRQPCLISPFLAAAIVCVRLPPLVVEFSAHNHNCYHLYIYNSPLQYLIFFVGRVAVISRGVSDVGFSIFADTDADADFAF